MRVYYIFYNTNASICTYMYIYLYLYRVSLMSGRKSTQYPLAPALRVVDP